MDYEDIEVQLEEDGDHLKAIVEFPEESESGLKVNTDFVARRVKEAGYDFIRYSGTDTIVDEPGEKVRGEWGFKIPYEEDDLEKKELKDLRGIGEKTAQMLVKKYDSELDLAENLESDEDIAARAKRSLREFLLEDK